MKTLKEYLALPYTTILRRDEDGDTVARVDELAGCAAHGATAEEALKNLEEVKQLWITDRLERGDSVPEPAQEETLPSGKWVQRVPRTLHRRIVQIAKHERASLNQWVTSVLAEAVGTRKAFPLPGVDTAHSLVSHARDVAGRFYRDTVIYGLSEPYTNWEFKSHAPRGVPAIGLVRLLRKSVPDNAKIKDVEYGSAQEKHFHHP